MCPPPKSANACCSDLCVNAYHKFDGMETRHKHWFVFSSTVHISHLTRKKALNVVHEVFKSLG
jgi:hypothetical protein